MTPEIKASGSEGVKTSLIWVSEKRMSMNAKHWALFLFVNCLKIIYIIIGTPSLLPS